MIFINIIIFLLLCMLAIISRKNYSKYKQMYKGCMKCLCLSMGEILILMIRAFLPLDKVSKSLRKLYVVSDEKLKDIAYRYMVKNAAICIIILSIFNLISVGLNLKNRYFPQPNNIIERADYQGEAEKHDIYLSDDEEETVYALQVSQMLYSKEQFIEEVDRIACELEETISGENDDLNNIYSDMKLEQRDSTGVFLLEWYSDYPEYVSSYGRVSRDGLEEDVKVTLKVEITYKDYCQSLEYIVVVKADKGNDEETDIDAVKMVLDELEKENRQSKIIELPEEINGVGISLYKEKKSKKAGVMICAIFACAFSILMCRSRVKENIKKRDNMLRMIYPTFVNKLCLLLGTGMTLKRCMNQIVKESKDGNVFIQELAYTLREIDSGMDEAGAYEQLGRRLGMPQYVRMMNHLSQNLRLGTRDIRIMMEEEVKLSISDRLEYAKKKGEEASSKLLFPMIILMAVVMVVIIFPAVMEF